MHITPMILGKGNAGNAIAKSLVIARQLCPELLLQEPIWLERNADLKAAKKQVEAPVLFIANPHGLHARAVIDAHEAGFLGICCEKPAAVDINQLNLLKSVTTPSAVFNVYRQTWGIQSLKKMIENEELGELIAVEGRYWQSSSAERALRKEKTLGWKDDPVLSGPSDCYLDVGCHWVDAVNFLIGNHPLSIDGWRSYVNSASAHRDTHIQLAMNYPKGGRAFGSISKTLHGATNLFEIYAIGALKSVRWQFLRPDELWVGEGRDHRILTRKTAEMGSRQSAFHALGWLEGYVEIICEFLRELQTGSKGNYPSLSQNIANLEDIFSTKWQTELNT